MPEPRQPTVLGYLFDLLYQKTGKPVYNTLAEVFSPPASGVALGGALVWGKGAQRVAGPLYHGTHTGVLDRILKEGLRPATETGVRHYELDLASAHPAVYFSRSPHTAAAIGEHAAREFQAEPVLLKVEQLPVKRFLPDEDIYPFVVKRLKDKPNLFLALQRSFRLRQDMLDDVLRELARLSGVPEHDISQVAIGNLWQLRPKLPFTLGNIAYHGTVPPKDIKIVALAKGRDASSLKKYFDAVQDEYRQVVKMLAAELRKHGGRLPIWLK